MKKACAYGALLLLTSAWSANAQTYPDDSVSATIGGGTVGGLLQPGEKPAAVIHLHMPTHHHVVTTVVRKPRAPKVAEAAPPPAPVNQGPSAMPEDSAGRLVSDNGLGGSAPAQPATAPVKPTKVPRTARKLASTPPPSQTPDNSAAPVPFSFDPEAAQAPPPTRAPRAAPAAPASATPAAAEAGLTRQSVIAFAAGDTSPAASDVNAIHSLAASLNSQLSSGGAKVELEAYGGPRGDKSSDSRRLSLKRALVVRELLIEDGIPSEKIDVRAMGGADSGSLDRVDIFVRA